MFKVMNFLTLGSLLLTGCVGVSPWERGNLSADDMQWELSRHESRLKEHIYSSKEAASGGAGPAGGGCGCN